MVDRVGLHRPDDADVVRHLRGPRQQLTDPRSALPVLRKLEDAGREGKGRLPRGHARESLALPRQPVLEVLLEPVLQVRLVVEDNGRGVETVSSGFGLLGLQERANLLNGSLVIQTGKDEGFRMEICIPG